MHITELSRKPESKEMDPTQAYNNAMANYMAANAAYNEATKAFDSATKAYRAAQAAYFASQAKTHNDAATYNTDTAEDYMTALAAYEKACCAEGNEPV